MIALLSPGQGAQTPGMLEPWLDMDGTAEFLAELSEAAQLDLRALGTTAGAETIKDTKVAQPLIVATSLLSARALSQQVTDRESWIGITAGHSVGEYAAVALAGILSPTDAVALVAARGRAMAAAAAQEPTGMSAVVGGKPDEVDAALHAHDLIAANVNGGGQVVVAGLLSDLQALAEEPPARTRVIPLPVAGAFHTKYMAPAVETVSQAAAGTRTNDPHVRCLSNADGAAVTTGTEALQRLVTQISAPVRWDLCQETMLDDGVEAAIELAPGGVLTGLARRGMRGVQTVALKSPDDLDAAARLIASH